MSTAADQAASPKPGSARRKILTRIVIAVVAIVGVAVGVPFYLHAVSHESTDDAFVEGHVVAVSPRVSGHIARVLVEDNQFVRAGEVLVELDPRDYQARLDAAEAAAAAARARLDASSLGVDLTSISSTSGLEGAEAGVAQAKAAVAQAGAELASARAELAQAKADIASAKAKHDRDAADLKRAQDMARTGAVSPQQLDHAVAAESISAAELSSAERKAQTKEAMAAQAEAARQASEQALLQAKARLAQAKSAPKQVAQSKSQAATTKAELQRADADLEQARLNLSYAVAVAPCDGYVTRKSAEAGAYVQAGQTLLSVVRPDVWVVANFKETQLAHMRPGQPAEVKVDAYPGAVFRGHVDSVQRGTGSRFSLLPPENATGNFVKVVQRVPVKIVLDREEGKEGPLLAPGMSVEPEVDVSAKAAEPVGTEKKAASADSGDVGSLSDAGKLAYASDLGSAGGSGDLGGSGVAPASATAKTSTASTVAAAVTAATIATAVTAG